MSKILHEFELSLAQWLDGAQERNQPYNADGQRFTENEYEKHLKQVNALIKKPAFTPADLDAYWDALKHINTTGIDDRLLLLEKLLVLMSRLSDSPWEDFSQKIQEFVIQTLYNDLPHPPSSYLAALDAQVNVATAPKGIKYAYRSADGSNYNPLFPTMGMAGTPYARTVPALHHVPKHALPDPGLVFDTLLKRDKFEDHPGGISSLFFAFADLIIHCIFDTSHNDLTINSTSSYLDLSILYGNSQAEQDKVRRQDGSGKLWDDAFADPRLLLMPPATCALLVLLSRNHNYIAQKLLDINESDNLVYPYPADSAARKRQDDEIFHRARLVNCGYFIKIILGDYVGSILGLVRDQSPWRLDPMLAARETSHEVSPRGEGNVCSIEFNLLYRWHATLSKQDTEWTTKMFNNIFEGKDLNKIDINDFKTTAHKYLIPVGDVRKREFGGIKRQEDGRFKDADLAKIIQNATEWPAGAFKARGIPEAMRIIEIMGIEQARSWGTCSLNEFRKFLGLKPYKSFKEWNKNPEIHTAATALYKDIDNLELHVGLQAEEAKSPEPGAGLCPGYTISRAILSDAVALTRGDRYLTTDFTPANATAWGYADCQYDPKDGSFGGMLTKLLFRHLPEYFPAGSAYAHFPFLVPSFMKDNLENQNPSLVNKYTWERPPVPISFVPATTYANVLEVVKHPSIFVSAYNMRLHAITAPEKSYIASRSDSQGDIERVVKGRRNVERLLAPDFALKPWPKYFQDEVRSLVADKSISHVGNDLKYVDIVGDVINLLPVQWIAEEIIGLPLKTVTHQRGEWRQQETYQRFADVGRYIFLNFDPIYDWRLRESALETFDDVHRYAKSHLDATCSFFKHTVQDTALHTGLESHHSHDFVKQAKDANPNASTGEVATYIFAAVVPTAAHFSQAIAHVIDFYLDEDKKVEREDIVKYSTTLDEQESVDKIMSYVREALRINPTVRGVYRTASQATKLGTEEVPAGARVFASVIDANQDKSEFGPDPTVASFNRTDARTGILGLGEHGLLSAGFFESVVPAILGEILSLNDIQRAPGESGKFAKFEEDWHGSRRQLYINSAGDITPFPDSLIIQYKPSN